MYREQYNLFDQIGFYQLIIIKLNILQLVSVYVLLQHRPEFGERFLLFRVRSKFEKC
jgi:hypothetical protein